MVEATFPKDRRSRRARLWTERLCVENAVRAVFCTPGARNVCAERYPNMPGSKWAIVANGYDEQTFAAVEQGGPRRTASRRQILLLHSGLLYPTEDRDPTAFFDALARLLGEGKVSVDGLQVVLRASGFDDYYGRLIRNKGLSDIVCLEPSVPYRDALAEMLRADGLLIFQGLPSNPAIPAKLYEYLRAQRPIFAMAHAGGDTARLLQDMRVGVIVPLDDREQIANGLMAFLDELSSGRAAVPTEQEVKRHSREARAAELARIFDDIVGRPLRA
jgi:glycosyltransferase involved in cell wall biosynthesis